MLKIGDFSRLAAVTVKTLRHYARIGLFKPTWTDRYTGYRYYALQQLPRLNRILALKDLGFSLDQVAAMIDEDVPVEQLRGMLRRKQAELEVRLRSEQNRLAMVAARLQQIEQVGNRGGEVLLKRTAPLPVASLRETVASVERLPERMSALVGELNSWLARSGVQAGGPWMALNLSPEYRERDIPVEIAVAVDLLAVRRAQEGSSRVRCQVLPAVEEMACLVHAGPQETLGQAYADLFAWMEANRRRAAGPARELYLRDTLGTPEGVSLGTPEGVSLGVFDGPVGEDGRIAQVVEVQLPVEPVAAVVYVNGLEIRKEPVMEPKIVTRPAFNVVGMCYHGRNQNQEISAMWGEFNQRGGEVAAHAVPNTNAYGVCLMVEGLPEGHFEYVAGLEVPDGAPVPEGMVLRHVPAQKYAVFAHRGSLQSLPETYHNVYHTWLPESGLTQMTPGMDMEVYTDEFKDFAPDSVFYIYVAIQ